MRYRSTLTSVLLFLLLSAWNALADSRVLSVTAENTVYGVRIRIEGSAPLNYDDFQLAAPRRLIVDIRDADVSRVQTLDVYDDITRGVEGISGFKVIVYEGDEDRGESSIGRLQFLLSEQFTISSYREGNVIILELTGLLEGAPEPEADKAPASSEKAPSYRVGEGSKPSWTTYGLMDISIMNFKAEGVPGGTANAYGLMMVGGVRLGEYFSFEGGLNWFPIGDANIVLPLPLMWMPSDGGVYLNIAGGVRVNLVEYSSNKAVPWLSAWSVGHAVISDFSVSGSGTAYGIGVDIKGDDGKVTQLALRFHQFDGDLTIHNGYLDFEYPDQEIRAVELIIGFGKK